MAKVTCPRCGQLGYLARVKVYNNYYMRVEHWEGSRRRICYLGRDVSDVKQMLMETIGNEVAAKVLKVPGGDYKIASLLLPRLESLCPSRCTFVEVFGGSGYMAQTVDRQKFPNVIYNDINNMLVALYRHVKEHPEQLATIISLLPYSRAYYRIVRDLLKANQDFGSLVAAALIFYTFNSTFHGSVMRKGFAYAIEPKHNEARAFRGRAWAIVKYAEMWKDIVIENLDFREVIKKYDSERTVFYLDPPYPDRAEDYYGTPFTADDLREMATMLDGIKGRFLLKLDKKMYKMISDILPSGKYNVEMIERKLHMQRVRGQQRETWTLVLVSR
jgi:DNA adenine methylase